MYCIGEVLYGVLYLIALATCRCPSATATVDEIAKRIEQQGGAALIIDYGRGQRMYPVRDCVSIQAVDCYLHRTRTHQSVCYGTTVLHY